MKIASYDEGVAFNFYNELISELATYGVIGEGADGLCEIVNPVYHYCIMQAFKPAVNGLEQDYFPADTRPVLSEASMITGGFQPQIRFLRYYPTLILFRSHFLSPREQLKNRYFLFSPARKGH